jgi:hypothetical protein
MALSPVSAAAQWPYPSPPGYYVPGELTAVRLMVTPRNAQVYVDGYYAGIVDDYDGVFQRLHLPPGDHDIVLYLDGYRTVHQRIYLTPDDTYKLRYKMEKNLAGESSEPPPTPPAPPSPPPGPQAGAPPGRPGYPPYPPRSRPPTPPAPPRRYPEPPPPAVASDFGTLIVRVQPAGAEIQIDGEAWRGPEGDERLVVQLAEGTHRVEVSKAGYRRYAGDVQVRRGETVPLNVALSPEGR